MIPASLFFAVFGEGALEVRALDLSPEAFSFRLAKGRRPGGSLTAWFYHPEAARWAKAAAETAPCTLLESGRDWDTWRCSVSDPAFSKEAGALSRTILTYVSLWQEGDAAGMEEQFSHFREDGADAKTLREKEKRWLLETRAIALPEGLRLGVLLSSPFLWQTYEKEGITAFWRFYRDAFLEEKGETLPAPAFLHLGSPFCPRLFPPAGELEEILNRMKEEGIHPVAVLSPMRESETEKIAERLVALETWAEKNGAVLETECNDLGELMLIRERGYTHLAPTAGVLLGKRRKDPRLPFLPGYDPRHLETTTMDDPLYQELFPFGRSAVETLDYVPRIPFGRGTLYGPYYATNVSGLCPLLAAEHTGDRGAQRIGDACAFDCEHNAFLYPDAERLAGIGNAILGFSGDAFCTEKLARARDLGADRLVLNFPGGAL